MSSDQAVVARGVTKEYKLGLTGRSKSIGTLAKERLRHPIKGSGSSRSTFRALDDVSFDIDRGEVVGVIGKNGAGKSTLLKILSRITTPTDGYVEMSSSVGSLLEVGTGFHPELTGLENVYLNGTILGMSRRDIDARLDEIVDFAEIDRFLATPVKRYSSGMRVRLAFAVAAHLEPEVMIIDEVLSVGDHGFQMKCLDKMQSIAADDGRTVVYVSHNLLSVESLCHRTMLMKDGKVVFDGPTTQAISQYMGLSAQGFEVTQEGVFDLHRVERVEAGTHTVFTQVVLRPSRGAPSHRVRMGEPLRIEVSVNGLDEVRNPIVLLWVTSATDETVFRMSTRMREPTVAGPRQERETFIIDIDSLPLTPGEYHLNAWAYHGPEHTRLDQVHQAATFTVDGADILGNGYQFTGRDGVTVVPFEWEIRPEASGEFRSVER